MRKAAGVPQSLRLYADLGQACRLQTLSGATCMCGGKWKERRLLEHIVAVLRNSHYQSSSATVRSTPTLPPDYSDLGPRLQNHECKICQQHLLQSSLLELVLGIPVSREASLPGTCQEKLSEPSKCLHTYQVSVRELTFLEAPDS